MPALTPYVALLRAVNVSGTGMLPMSQLRAMGEACGFAQVRTFIASGNLLFAIRPPGTDVREAMARRVPAVAGGAGVVNGGGRGGMGR